MLLEADFQDRFRERSKDKCICSLLVIAKFPSRRFVPMYIPTSKVWVTISPQSYQQMCCYMFKVLLVRQTLCSRKQIFKVLANWSTLCLFDNGDNQNKQKTVEMALEDWYYHKFWLTDSSGEIKVCQCCHWCPSNLIFPPTPSTPSAFHLLGPTQHRRPQWEGRQVSHGPWVPILNSL